MERFNGQDKYHLWYEHWHRYHWVAPLLADQSVADMACGEGYGSALMAKYARQVVAMDIDLATIEAAQKKYPAANLVFHQGYIIDTSIDDGVMDVVVSFETLEHMAEHQALIKEFKRILRPGGVMVLSTPNKDVSSGIHQHNEHHVKELTAEQFNGLVTANFAHVLFFGQTMQTQSVVTPALWPPNGSASSVLYAEYGKEQLQPSSTGNINAAYMVAVASDDEASLESFRQLGSSCFNDANNALYEHYEQQVADYMTTDQRLKEANKRIEALQKQAKQQSLIISQLQSRLGL